MAGSSAGASRHGARAPDAPRLKLRVAMENGNVGAHSSCKCQSSLGRMARPPHFEQVAKGRVGGVLPPPLA